MTATVQTGCRIVSLLPSATEIVGCLGLQDQLVGTSHECDICPDPHGLQSIMKERQIHRVTSSPFNPAEMEQGEINATVYESLEGGLSLYKVSRDLLQACAPTVILTQMLCEVCAATPAEVEAAICEALLVRPQIVNLEPGTVSEIADSIEQIAKACGVPERAAAAMSKFKGEMAAVKAACEGAAANPSVLLLEWIDPPFDGGHWVPEQIENAGCRTAWGGQPGEKSRSRTWEEVFEKEPDVVLVACCGFDLKRNLSDAAKNIEGKLDKLKAFKEGRVFAVDGNRYFARPSPSVAHGSALVARCAHAADAAVVAKLEALPFLPAEGEGWARVS